MLSDLHDEEAAPRTARCDELGARLGGRRTATAELVQRPLLDAAERAAGLLAKYHQAKLRGAHHVPEGAALLVGNHGVYGYDTPVLFWLLRQHTGRYPIGLADKVFSKLPILKHVLPMLGGVEGTPKNAVEALRRGELVVCYPGGAHEVFKTRDARYALRWERALGFARCAAAAQVPVVPFAGYGVDHAFVLTDSRVKLSRETDRYTAPLGLPVPLPVPFHFHVGAPLDPPRAAASDAELGRFRDEVAARVRSLLVRACHG